MPRPAAVLPPLVPRRGNRFTRWLGRVVLRLLRWEFMGEFPNLPKMVVIVAPHSSNWDFIVGVAVMFALGFDANFIGKKELFRGPVGILMRWLGGIPVDRSTPQGQVGQLRDALRQRERVFLAITPEGTRKPVTQWKRGFYHIAHAAGIPIAPVYFDNVTRRVGFFPVLTPTGDADRDIAALRARYAGLLRRDQLPDRGGPVTRALGLAVLLSLGPIPGSAQEPAGPAGWDTFVRGFDAYAARDSIVGASVIVVRRGRVTARHDVGWADRDRRQHTDSSTIYHWGSITKTLTAVAVMQLRDRGRLSLDDPVTRYIPELRQVHNPWGSMDDVTIGMLLSHSAGFQGPTWPYTTGEPWEPFEPTRWEQLVAMLPYQRLWFAPGSRYGYSNPAFIYLARVIERLTGDAWQSYVYKNLFGPLDLTRSYFAATPYHLEPDRSNSYVVVRDSGRAERVVANGREFDPGITIPNGGWNAPAADIARWFAFLAGAAPADSVLARRYDGVLARRSIGEMWQSRFTATDPVAGAAVAPDSVGLSIFVLGRHGVRFVGHTGSQAGFRAFAYLNPATGAAVIAAFNTRNDAREGESAAGFRAVRDAALGLIAR